MFCSISVYYCPTRRGAGSQSDPEASVSGPSTDFCMVFAIGQPAGNAYFAGETRQGMAYLTWASLPWRAGSTVAMADTFNHGPFLSAHIDVDKTSDPSYVSNGEAYGIRSWTARADFARWQDGTSNQLIFGEKAIHTDKLRACNLSNGHHDCTFLAGTGANSTNHAGRVFLDWNPPPAPAAFTIGGTWRNIVPPRPNPTDTQYYHSFGSWHPGICNFLLGDGSVRAVSVTTPADPILFSLSVVSSGQSVSLP